MEIIIPTRGRSGVIGDKAPRLFPDATLCVGEDERDAYAKVSGCLLVHPSDVVGISPLRQWVLDHVEDPWVVMVDDDVTHAYSQVGFHKLRIEDADTARAIVERLAILAADAGVRVFGFNQAARPLTYANFRPFSLATWVRGLVGIIGRELVELFPGLDGLVLEAENMDLEMPHRVPLYNRWAKQHGRKPFGQLGHPLWGKTYDVPEWRDYTTHSKARLFNAVQAAVREDGFAGDFATFCEVGARYSRYSPCQAVNIAELLRLCPGWTVVTYQYEKWMYGASPAEFRITRPKLDGARVFYLPGGVMTVGDGPTDHGAGKWPLPIPLAEHWRMDVEDVEALRPDGIWSFGAGALNDGVHVSLSRLIQAGYRDGDDARRAPLAAASPLRAACAEGGPEPVKGKGVENVGGQDVLWVR